MATVTDLTGYRRVSTQGQVTDGLGLPVQKKRITGYAKPHGFRIIDWQEDPGITGTKDAADRPGIMACLKAIQAGKSQGILITDLGRLSRLLTVQEAILAKIWEFGGVVVTVETGIVEKDDPDDPMRTAMRQMMGVFFQLDRAMVVKRLRNGRHERLAMGGYGGGVVKYGFRAEGSAIVPDDSEQAILARMRAMSDAGDSLRVICAVLNGEGIPARNGGGWHPQTVSRALARE